MEKYLAIFYGGENTKLVNFEATPETLDAQRMLFDIHGDEDTKSILVIRSGSPAVATFYKGEHFSTHTATIEGTCDIIKDWIDNLDEPEAIMELLSKVTGAVNVRLIGSGDSAKIGWDLP